ncbi:Phosphatidylserine decarboxylase proenzyme 1 [Escovopsis weberi]|uniref:Phosphatidylserine decarboxylase proenzyme 1, mitochondrial n=1 Tax=Escovopsis weberi TaxID=150374 RepID=A0A0M8MV09_ESCWE|nr:Phosphatidylserine decarboxylase proenzyme 1 [Escovopsis weberi]
MASLGIGQARLPSGGGRLLSSLHGQRAAQAGFRTSHFLVSCGRARGSPLPVRSFSSSSSRSGGGKRPRFSRRLGEALRNSKIEWYHIPVGLGIGFLGVFQFLKIRSREARKEHDLEEAPKPRPRIRPSGPWQVQVMSTLPLKAISRIWGKFNELTIPYFLRVPGFRLYSFIFGVNLDEVAEPDLHTYPNLAAFFYRTLKPGARPLDPDANALLSPSDGKILQFGQIQGGDIEQVKGMTYSIDALLGKQTPPSSISSGSSGHSPHPSDHLLGPTADEDVIRQEEQFAKVNGISYTLPDLMGGSGAAAKPNPASQPMQTQRPPAADESLAASSSAVSQVRADLARADRHWYHDLLSHGKPNALYYAVIYLAPGDYHRFHSPANWVVERRRHFAGELYSVSPYLQRTMPGLFTLNERVVLLGRWRWGFFSYVPVGATNVGSIVVNFDRELRTNSLLTDTAADRAAEDAARRGEPYLGFAEATYRGASRVLGGRALRRGEEMGGFQLGSTIVLVFEAPAAAELGGEKRGWEWAVEKGQTVKMGQALGRVHES